MTMIERETGRRYRLLRVYREGGSCLDRFSLRRYDAVKRYAR